MNFKKLSGFLTFSVIFSILIIPLALSQSVPCYPNAFYGNAVANGAPAPAGLTVTAEVNGAETTTALTTEGKYGMAPHYFYVKDNDNNCENTGTVEFFIQGQPAGQATFQNGYFTLLDLSANNVNIPQPPAPSPSPSGGGGGGGGSLPACTPQWSCSEWSQCLDSSQDRECVDLNQCGSEEGKPSESQTCGIESVLPSNCVIGESTCVGNSVWKCMEVDTWVRSETCPDQCFQGACIETIDVGLIEEGEPELTVTSPITGLQILEPANLPYLGILIIIILVILYLLFFRGGSKKEPEKKKSDSGKKAKEPEKK